MITTIQPKKARVVPDISLKDILAEQEILERELLHTLRDFESRTGVMIMGVTVSFSNYIGERKHDISNVKVEVSL